MTFLIVDDEIAARTDLVKVLGIVEKDAEVLQASGAEEALAACRQTAIDVALVDIRMPQTDGLALAKEITAISPRTNIIITTAYPEYALKAFSLYVSGYLLKPVLDDDLREALKHLRSPVNRMGKGLYVRCFGHFEVFYDGTPLKFGRSQAKELFAYLIDRRGASVTNAECCAVLWGDGADGSRKQRDYFHHIWLDLKNTLEKVGCVDVLEYSWNAYAIRPDRIRCDLYEEAGSPAWKAGHDREYMSQFSWAEQRFIP